MKTDAQELLNKVAGPNHVLPTGGTARHSSGLSVLTFLRARTWMRLESGKDLQQLAEDSAKFAEWERLSAHAAAARMRMP